MALKIKTGNTVEYKLRKGEVFGTTTKGTVTANVASIDGTSVRLVEGDTSLDVTYHRSRFSVVTSTEKPKKAKREIFRAGEGEETKKARAIRIYSETEGDRSKGLPRIMSELGLGKSGASTYWQHIKAGRWS